MNPSRVEIVNVQSLLGDRFKIICRDDEGEKEFTVIWASDHGIEGLQDTQDPSLQRYMDALYPLKISEIVSIVRNVRQGKQPEFPIFLTSS